MFLTYIFPQPITIPLNCDFVYKSYNFIDITPLIKYEGEWYLPIIISIDNLTTDWHKAENSEWINLNDSSPFPADSIIIDTLVLYIANYPQNTSLTLDSWYTPYPNPKLICGFGDVLSGLENINPQTPSNYSLLQNYPNPFNPNTKIQFTIPATSNVCLDIYNALGQKVATLVNQELIVGTYQYDFNATNLPSGNYFYTLTSTDGYITTKKMTLLK